MRTIYLLVVGLLAVAAGVQVLSAENRTFTDLQGRTIEASIVSATETEVAIKRADGRDFTLQLEKLIPADREYVAQWRTENAALAAASPGGTTGDGDGADTAAAAPAAPAPSTPAMGKLEATYKVDKKKTGSRKLGKDKSEDKWCYEIEISNRAREAVPQLTVKYELFVRYYSKYMDKKRGVARTEPGEYVLKGLPPQGRATFKTASVAAMTDKSRELNGDIVISTHYVEDLEGIILKFYQGEREVGEYSYGKVKRD